MAAGLKYVEELGSVSATIVGPLPLPVDLVAWFGSLAPTVGQKPMAASLPVTLASDQTRIVTKLSAPVSTVSSVAASIVSATVLAANATRLGACIYNDSAAILRLKLGAVASAIDFTIELGMNDYYEVPFGYTGVIDGIWTAAVGSARVTELTP